MTYFVMVHRRDGLMENARVGGYKRLDHALNMYKRYSTAAIKVYTGTGLKIIKAKVKGKEV